MDKKSIGIWKLAKIKILTKANNIKNALTLINFTNASGFYKHTLKPSVH